MRKLFAIACIALVWGCQPSDKVVINGNDKAWVAKYSKGDGVDSNYLVVTQQGQGCTFPFPQNGHINYLDRWAYTGNVRDAAGKKFMVLKFKIDGNAKFVPLDGANTGIHPYFEEGELLNGWWAALPYAVKPEDIINKGVQTVKIPLTPESWGNVGGQNGATSDDTKAQFAQAVKYMGHVGLTFGCYDGGCYGHGIKIKDGGNATFTLVSVTFTN